MSKLNWNLLNEIKKEFTKQAFVPGDAMAGDPAAAGGAPMDPAAMGGAPMDPAAMDPAAMGGAPMDPAAMGGAPMDPSMMGGAPMDPSMMPPPPPDPSMGETGSSPNMISMSSDEFLKFVKQIVALCTNSKFGGDAQPQQSNNNAVLEAKLDSLISRLG